MLFNRLVLLAFLAPINFGCTSEKHLEPIILGAFPKSVAVEIETFCTHIMGPAVAVFSYEGAEPDTIREYQAPNGSWTHSSSLGRFAEISDSGRGGLGVGITILDGKKCLREVVENADDILFQPNPGLYYRSDEREIVVILPESTPGEGMLFIQAP